MLIVSPLVASASGSLAGLTASRNKAGQYFRARAVPTNPNTAKQAAIRAIIGILADRWTSVVSEADRDDWETYAANTPLPATLGGTKLVSGQNMYIRANSARAQSGLVPIDAAPAIFDTGAFTQGPITCGEASQNVGFEIDNTEVWANDDLGAMLVYVSRPQNATINYFKGPYRYAGKIDGDSMTPPMTAQTIAVPFPVIEGQRIFTRTLVNMGDGRTTPDKRTDALVGA